MEQKYLFEERPKLYYSFVRLLRISLFNFQVISAWSAYSSRTSRVQLSINGIWNVRNYQGNPNATRHTPIYDYQVMRHAHVCDKIRRYFSILSLFTKKHVKMRDRAGH